MGGRTAKLVRMTSSQRKEQFPLCQTHPEGLQLPTFFKLSMVGKKTVPTNGGMAKAGFYHKSRKLWILQKIWTSRTFLMNS